MKNDVRCKELVRGKILYYLSLVYPESTPVPLLQGELDIFGFPVPLEDLNYHIAYLKEKGYVMVDNVRGPAGRGSVTLVRITAHGIDYKDGRLPVDEGVYLEPQS